MYRHKYLKYKKKYLDLLEKLGGMRRGTRRSPGGKRRGSPGGKRRGSPGGKRRGSPGGKEEVHLEEKEEVHLEEQVVHLKEEFKMYHNKQKQTHNV